jgi:diguanylate cyclase (GGDEF)-like protein
VLQNSQFMKQSRFLTPGEATYINRAQLAQKSEGQTLEALLLEASQELESVWQEYQNLSPTLSECGAMELGTNGLLSRAVQCAMKQHMLQRELCAQAFTDELTGLYNRRGFFSLAEQQLKLAVRTKRELLLFVIDVDGLKRINDKFGHSVGDLALTCAADALSATFRDSDILSRIGGDEFAVLALETSGQSQSAIVSRLHKSLKLVNTEESPYMLSLSVGSTRFDPGDTHSLAELMQEADRAMYEVKRSRKLERSAILAAPGPIPTPAPKRRPIAWDRRASVQSEGKSEGRRSSNRARVPRGKPTPHELHLIHTEPRSLRAN